MTEYDKKWLWIFIGAEVVSYLFARLLKLLVGFIPTPTSETAREILALGSDLILPITLIAVALIILVQYKKNRDGQI